MDDQQNNVVNFEKKEKACGSRGGFKYSQSNFFKEELDKALEDIWAQMSKSYEANKNNESGFTLIRPNNITPMSFRAAIVTMVNNGWFVKDGRQPDQWTILP